MACKAHLLSAAFSVAVLSATPTFAADSGMPDAATADASYPAAGRKIEVDFKVTAFQLDFVDSRRMAFLGTAGTSKGVSDVVDYTAREIRPGLYMVYWHEPKTGNNVVHVQDFNNNTVHTNIAQPNGEFLHLDGNLRFDKLL